MLQEARVQSEHISTTYNFVLSRTRNYGTLDGQTGGVSGNITLHLGHLAMCNNKRDKR